MDDIDIFVISGGKCGSSTLRETFLSNQYKCIKAHNPQCFKSQFGYDGFYDTIDKCSIKKNLIIVDSYRTPIERKISSFFHNGQNKIPNFLNLSIPEQIALFNDKYLYTLENNHIINDIYKYYNIPDDKIYDVNRKYLIQQHNNLVIIKLHYNDIKEWGKILSNIFKKPIKLISSNVTNTKPYYNAYKEFLNTYKVPKEYLLEELSNDEHFKKYQTPEQQNYYIDYWLKKSF